MRRTNPELNISSEAAHAFLTQLREYLLSSSKVWDVCRAEIFRLMELQATLKELSYFDVSGRARVATTLARIVVRIPLKMKDAWERDPPLGETEENPSPNGTVRDPGYLGAAFWVVLTLVDRSCENVDWVLSQSPWHALKGLTFTSVFERGRGFFYGKGLTAS